MAVLILGIDLSGRTITPSLPNGTTFSNLNRNNGIIAESSGGYKIIEYMVSGTPVKHYTSILYPDLSEVSLYRYIEGGASTNTARTLPDDFGVLSFVDAEKVSYPYLSRTSHEKHYLITEDMARVEGVSKEDIENMIIAIANGGTGATDAATARLNLGITLANLGAAAASHKHGAGDIDSGTLNIARIPTITVAKGGTGATDAATARSNLGITLANLGAAAASHNHAASNITSGTLGIDRLPTVTVAKGGTGATDAATARSNLGITLANLGAAAASHNHAASAINSGTLGIDRLPTVTVAKGGTGATDAATARSNLGITLANLGAAAASHNHAASNITSGTLGIDRLPTVTVAKGGTGGTTKATGRTGLGITSGTAAPSGGDNGDIYIQYS